MTVHCGCRCLSDSTSVYSPQREIQPLVADLATTDVSHYNGATWWRRLHCARDGGRRKRALTETKLLHLVDYVTDEQFSVPTCVSHASLAASLHPPAMTF